MKPAPDAGRGRIDYHARLARVVAHLHEHLAEPIRLEQLADIAHLSPFHWHRVYHALYGETIAATLRRLRLQRASGYLANTSLPIAEVARRCGYPNVQSFTRAFRTAYGAGPSRYRAEGGHAVFRAGTAAVQQAGYDVTLRAVPPLRLAAVEHRGSYMRIGKAFETAHLYLAPRGWAGPGARWLAVYRDDPSAVPEAQLSACAGLSLPPEAPQDMALPPPLVPVTLGGCTCAVLRYRGPYASMRAAYQWLYGHWLVASGYAAGDQPVFEEYLNHPRDTAPQDLLTDILLPLALPGCGARRATP